MARQCLFPYKTDFTDGIEISEFAGELVTPNRDTHIAEAIFTITDSNMFRVGFVLYLDEDVLN